MDVTALIQRIQARPDYAGQLEHLEVLPERPGRFATPDEPLAEPFGGYWRRAASSSFTAIRWPRLKRLAPGATWSSSPARPAAKRFATTCRFWNRPSPPVPVRSISFPRKLSRRISSKACSN